MNVLKFVALTCALTWVSATAAEIKGKDGRSFVGSIVSASEDAVIVKRALDGKVFTMQRIKLSDDTNELIDDHLENGDDEEFETEDEKDVPFPVSGSSDAYRVKSGRDGEKKDASLFVNIPLPNPKVTEQSSGLYAFKNGDTLKIELKKELTTQEAAKEELSKDKTSKLERADMAAAQGNASNHDVKKLDEVLEMKKVKWGVWKGYVYEDWSNITQRSDLGTWLGTRIGFFTNGEIGIKVSVKEGDRGNFRTKLQEIVESTRVKLD